MLIKTLTAAAALSLVAGAAFAQKTPDKHVDMPISAQTGKAVAEALAPPASSADQAATEVAATELSIFNKPETPYVTDAVSGPLSDPNVVVTNGPVADTAENRMKYRPLSNAGRRSGARGN